MFYFIEGEIKLIGMTLWGRSYLSIVRRIDEIFIFDVGFGEGFRWGSVCLISFI